MTSIAKTLSRLLKSRSGNISILATISLPLVVYSLALAVDYGHLTMQQRKLQSTADIASIVAAANIGAPERSLLSHFMADKESYAVQTKSGFLTVNGEVNTDVPKFLDTVAGYAVIELGQYTADSKIAVEKRFVPNAKPFNAARVSMREKGELFFASAIASPPKLEARGIAARQTVAAYSVGSRLASLNGGVLNSLLSGLLGTTVSLKAMDYEALVDADVNALYLADQLALDLGITAGTYDDLLKTRIRYAQLLNSLTKTTGIKPTVAAVLRTLETAANKSKVTLKLEDVLRLDPYANRQIGTGENFSALVEVYDLVSAGAVAGNGGKQVALDLGSSVPGIGSLKVTVAIGEPPAQTPPTDVGSVVSIVRTAQTRLRIELVVDGLSALAGLQLRVPLYLELAHAEARLSAIRCLGGIPTNTSVDVEVVPGVAEVSLGNVDTTAFQNFGDKPRVTQATILDSALLRVKGMAHINAANTQTTTLNFQAADIRDLKIKSVSTQNTLTSLVTSLLNNLDAKIEILFLSLGTQKTVQSALANTLSTITEPLDSVLYNLLLTLGIKIGKADVRVTAASCQRPALVQ